MHISPRERQSQRMELVVARTSRIRRAQLIFIDHRVVKLWALRTEHSRDISQHN